jgi:hypothetical protein
MNISRNGPGAKERREDEGKSWLLLRHAVSAREERQLNTGGDGHDEETVGCSIVWGRLSGVAATFLSGLADEGRGVSLTWQIAEVGDVDGNGKADLV